MGGSRWKIGKVKVEGNAMFGDDNQMQVVAPSMDFEGLNVPNQGAVAAALAHLNRVIQVAPGKAQETLSDGDKSELREMVRQIVNELRKPRESQNPGVLRQCVDKVLQVAKAVPPLVKVAVELKTLFGF